MFKTLLCWGVPWTCNIHIWPSHSWKLHAPYMPEVINSWPHVMLQVENAIMFGKQTQGYYHQLLEFSQFFYWQLFTISLIPLIPSKFFSSILFCHLSLMYQIAVHHLCAPMDFLSASINHLCIHTLPYLWEQLSTLPSTMMEQTLLWSSDVLWAFATQWCHNCLQSWVALGMLGKHITHQDAHIFVYQCMHKLLTVCHQPSLYTIPTDHTCMLPIVNTNDNAMIENYLWWQSLPFIILVDEWVYVLDLMQFLLYVSSLYLCLTHCKAKLLLSLLLLWLELCLCHHYHL